MALTPSVFFVRAFERNCPNVRMTAEERDELGRLFWEAQKASFAEGNEEKHRELLFLCRKCEAHYAVDEPTTRCPVCDWQPGGIKSDPDPMAKTKSPT